MGFFNSASSEIGKEPMFVVLIILLIYVVTVPILSFFMDFWFVFLLVTVMLILGWFAVKTVYSGQGKIGKGGLTNVP